MSDFDDTLSPEETRRLQSYLDSQVEATRLSSFELLAASCQREVPFDCVRVGERYVALSSKRKPSVIFEVVAGGGQKYFQLLSSRHDRINCASEMPLAVSVGGVYRREPPHTPLPLPKTDEAWNQLPRDQFGMKLWFWRVLCDFVHGPVVVAKATRSKHR